MTPRQIAIMCISQALLACNGETDSAGCPLWSAIPTDEDWRRLAEDLDREPTPVEQDEFERVYCEVASLAAPDPEWLGLNLKGGNDVA